MKTTFRQSFNKGFTLIELLIVIAILGTLAGIAYPTYMSVQEGAQKSAAKKVCNDIVEGCVRFSQDNNGMLPYNPDDARADNNDQIFLTSQGGKDAGLITILTNREDGDERVNATRDTYLRSDEQEQPRDGLYIDDSGLVSFYDPWAQPYYIVLCEDDQGCYDPFVRRKRLRGKKCLVYSTGPDQVGVAGGHSRSSRKSGAAATASKGVEDNVYSWKKEK